jgi:hypothetical protein
MIVSSGSALAGPTFILNDTGGVGAGTAARAGFQAAAALWASQFTNNVTVRLDVGFRTLGSGILGSTSSSKSDVAYSAVRSSLVTRASTPFEAAAAATLAPTLSFLSNEAGNCATNVGRVAATPTSRTLDADNTRDNAYLSVTTANQKALGLRADTGQRDGAISFNSAYNWDFNRADGVTTGMFDFVGAAAHEIGHALGFTLGVDLADGFMGIAGLDQLAWGTPLDLFRYSGTQRDWTVGGAPCLSADGGLTCLGALSTGRTYGDRQQASHWKSGAAALLRPTSAAGVLMPFSTVDIAALDLIGWRPGLSSGGIAWTSGLGATGAVGWTTNLSFDGSEDTDTDPVPTPAPSPAALLAIGGFALLARRARRR